VQQAPGALLLLPQHGVQHAQELEKPLLSPGLSEARVTYHHGEVALLPCLVAAGPDSAPLVSETQSYMLHQAIILSQPVLEIHV
jgi:hypothetical protein